MIRMANMNKKLEKQYQSMTALEHISKKPDTYIGAIETDDLETWALNENNTKFEHRVVKWVPGLYKCFDEAIVNARDHAIRMQLSKEKKKHLVKNIEVSCIDGIIEIMNDGNGIDIAMHPKDKLWIPEMIFMHLRTSTNYDDEEKKLVGGKNGYGIKLVFVFAKWGEIETIDHIRKLKYTQRVENNLSKIHPPKIEKYTGKPYTKVRWMPDYAKFGLDAMTPDIWSLLRKRAFDIAAVTSKSLKVKIQGKNIDINSFGQYVDMYIGNKEDAPRISQESDRWECIVGLSPLDEFSQVSFVNGIYTGKGGKHVDYVTNQITKKMIEYIKRKKKITVKATTIKEQLIVFVNCMIENPAFDSQTKDYMNTPYSKFGSKFEITDKVIDKLAKMGVMDAAISLNEVKQMKKAKTTDGRKSRSIRGIPKLVDANKAGGPSSHQCTLILTEGDSAKAGVMSGLTKEDRNWFGIFPLKGKLLNTRDSPIGKINNNTEIANIKKIMGLQTGKTFKDKEDMKKVLRYGKIMILTDQDLDGHHIKGLTINLFSSQWNDLFKMNDFLGYMNTPIIKATKGKSEKTFYNEKQYETWKEQNNGGKGWKIKYYKGLGTSTGKEFKEYFAKKKFIMFDFTGDISEDSVDKAFNKSRADDRKEWLGGYDRNLRLDINKKKCPVENFIDRELIHFAKYDCERSICNLVDGFKTSQRKIAYAAFKRNLSKEIKVAQFSGYVSEHSCYHHGEMSLNMAIVKLAQEFVGSNNINVLMPNGQFGTRLGGGKDHASERYIFTELNKLTRYVFPENDDKILNYLDDDGTRVEPDFYLPILPMILVNGGKGIGTGFSQDVMSYDVKALCRYVKMLLKGETKNFPEILPYYEGFKGDIIKTTFVNKDDKRTYLKYIFKGKYQVISSDTIRVTELPVGYWTDNFKEDLESLMDDKKKKAVIRHIQDDSTDATVDFKIKFVPGVLSELMCKKVDDNINMLEKVLKLKTTRSTSNMYLFDEKQQLHKYHTVEDIIKKYYPIRLMGYKDRKEYILKALSRKIAILSNKARFIKEQCDDTLDLRKKKKDVVIELLKSKGFATIDGDEEYKYLRSMTIDSVEEENMEKLLKEREVKLEEYKKLNKTSIQELWLEDLDNFEKEYKKYCVARNERLIGTTKKKRKVKKKKTKA